MMFCRRNAEEFCTRDGQAFKFWTQSLLCCSNGSLEVKTAERERERHADSGRLAHEVSEARKDSVRNRTGAFRVVFLSRIWHHSACFLRSRVKLHGEMMDWLAGCYPCWCWRGCWNWERDWYHCGEVAWAAVREWETCPEGKTPFTRGLTMSWSKFIQRKKQKPKLKVFIAPPPQHFPRVSTQKLM